MSAAKVVGGGAAVVAVVVGLSWGMGYLSYFYNKTFQPLNEQVRYDTQRSSRAFNESQIHDLRDLYLQWRTADPEGKRILAQSAIRTADLGSDENLPGDLRDWVLALRNAQGN